MSGPISIRKAEEIAARIEAKGLVVRTAGIFAVGADGHVKLTVTGLPEQWDALLSQQQPDMVMVPEELAMDAITAFRGSVNQSQRIAALWAEDDEAVARCRNWQEKATSYIELLRTAIATAMKG